MIVIDNSKRKIQISMNEAHLTAQVEWLVSYDSFSTNVQPPNLPLFASQFVSKQTSMGVTNDTTAVDMIPLFANDPARNDVQFISVYNADNGTHTVNIIFIDTNGAGSILFNAVLATGEKMIYESGRGFQTYNALGGIK